MVSARPSRKSRALAFFFVTYIRKLSFEIEHKNSFSHLFLRDFILIIISHLQAFAFSHSVYQATDGEEIPTHQGQYEPLV